MILDLNSVESAERNRQSIANGIGNEYFDSLPHQTAQWSLGETAPEWVILGELPYHNRLSTAPKYIAGEDS